jgi:hypothetical protein
MKARLLLALSLTCFNVPAEQARSDEPDLPVTANLCGRTTTVNGSISARDWE